MFRKGRNRYLYCVLFLCLSLQLSATALPELWTFSGINAWSEEHDTYDEYVGTRVIERIPGAVPSRQYYSRLGTSPWYPEKHQLRGMRAHVQLNAEAADFANGAIDYPPIKPGMFSNTRVKVMLIAPKTRTRPPEAEGLCIEVYWSPLDAVPNQRVFAPQPWHTYRRGTGSEWIVYNPFGEGLGRGHDFAGFFQTPLSVMRRMYRYALKQRRRKWIRTSRAAPDIITVLSSWLKDPAIDYVFVGHSQGANIITHILQKGFE